jgi:hypothetical protein
VGVLHPTDEGRHPPGGEGWTETWVFDAWRPDASAGTFTWLTLLPNERKAWYWSVLVRPGEPQIYVADLDVPLPASGLGLRTHGLWADHTCEAPFEQWTVQNECHAVALADPRDALGTGFGDMAPLAIDMEWYGTEPAETVATGYRQSGEAHALVELAGGPLELVGPAARRHTWGGLDGDTMDSDSDDDADDRQTFLPAGPIVVVRRLTVDGWRTTFSPPAPAPRGGA